MDVQKQKDHWFDLFYCGPATGRSKKPSVNKSWLAAIFWNKFRHMRQLIFIPILLISLYSYGQEQKDKSDYPLQVGDIYFDSTLDNPNFKLCNDTLVLQYYNLDKGLQYKGEKTRINEYFKEGLKKVNGEKDDTGFLTIRFIVNCEGKTGRFRVQGMDNNYNQVKFSDGLTNQLLTLTKQMDGWIAGEYEEKFYDYYQYLTFKIEGGNLVEIMP